MSKRFGRKQKRKLREQVVVLEKEKAAKQSKIDRMSYLVNLITEWDENIRRLLGPQTAFRLKTELNLVDRTDLPEYWRVFYAPSINCFESSVAMSHGPEVAASIQNLRKMMVEIRQRPDDFRKAIRLIVANKQQAAIYVDDDYLSRNGLTERDIRWVAEDIARQLALGLNREYGHDCH